jgi:hypothetical protein
VTWAKRRSPAPTHETFDYGTASEILIRMKVFIVFAHSEPRSFNGAMFTLSADAKGVFPVSVSLGVYRAGKGKGDWTDDYFGLILQAFQIHQSR